MTDSWFNATQEPADPWLVAISPAVFGTAEMTIVWCLPPNARATGSLP